MAALPEPSEEMAHLPRVIRTLVQRRRTVKDLIKREADPVGGRGMAGWSCQEWVACGLAGFRGDAMRLAAVATPALFEICPCPALPASRCGASSWRFDSRRSS